ncbi:MAG: hypothetical protein DSY76_04155 [Bacteroidetes bacterium]|nr:MAG: hypothetical protein DSY76_04155 [Bacteroidota bacterium]
MHLESLLNKAMIKFISILLFPLLLLAACNKDVPPPLDPDGPSVFGYKMELEDEFLLDIAEPSGLSWAINHKDLIVVDDRTNKAYIIDVHGKQLSEFPYSGDDTEGVTLGEANNSIWIAEEAESKLIELNTSGNEVHSYKIDVNRGSKKKGLEGLTYDSNEKMFYILNEAEPGLLIKWTIDGGIQSETQLHFAQDYSGIFFDNADQSLWIVSDQSQKLFYCDKNGLVKQSFDLGFPKAEGVVVDHVNNKVYIVSDSERKLFIFKITKL